MPDEDIERKQRLIDKLTESIPTCWDTSSEEIREAIEDAIARFEKEEDCHLWIHPNH